MRKSAVFLLLLLQFSCKKEHGTPVPLTPANTTLQGILTDTSFIHVAINQIPMIVKTIKFDRESSTVHFVAANGLQKIEADTYHLWGTSGFSYQYQDTLTYGSRKDTISQWQVVTAPYVTSGVFYDCCMLPTKDSPVNGTFKADFGVEGNLFIEGDFHLIFK